MNEKFTTLLANKRFDIFIVFSQIKAQNTSHLFNHTPCILAYSEHRKDFCLLPLEINYTFMILNAYLNTYFLWFFCVCDVVI